jgi:uncharacterized protein (UPF0262 family)
MHAHACITRLTLDDASIIRRTPEVEHERRIAMADLVEENQFTLLSAPPPYEVFLSARDNRLLLQVSATHTTDEPHEIILALRPFQRLIKDYFLMCESYFEAIKHAPADRIQTLDMARRSVHNEGAELLSNLLAPHASMDFDTARRLFTLICVLHIK